MEGGVDFSDLVYHRYTVYVVRAMKTGYSIRISVPRLVQRHMGLRVGDCVFIRTLTGGRIEAWKVSMEELQRARVSRDPAGSD